ncbi:MAG: PAS domain S-box protein, partial [Anaerolineales bacterium]|nr:PAS domain S-box protein [Anaerolineales bacterium]
MVQGEGENLRVVGLVSDITEQAETQAILREIESRYNAFVEQTLDGVAVVQGGAIQFGNQALVDLLGYELDELVGQQFLEYVLPEQREMVENRNIARHAGKAVLSRYEIQMVHKSGRVVDIELSAGIIQHQGYDASFVILRDITEQKLALEEIQRSEQRFRAVFNSMNDTIFIRDENKRLLDINRAAFEMYGYTAAEFAELSIEEISLGEPPYTTKEASVWLDKAAAEGPQRFEWRARHKDGHLFWVDISAQTAQFGERFLYVVAIRNIEKQKEAERALRQSEEKFAGAFHASPDSITIATWPSGRLIDANEGFERISGYGREEVLGKHTSQLDIYWDAAERQRVIKYFQTHDQVRNFEFKGRRKNGQPFPASLSSEFIQLGGETCSITTVRDLTEQKEAEQALRFSEEKFVKAFHATPDSISITDISTNQLIELNHGFEQVFGYSREEALRKTGNELGLYAHPEDRERLLGMMRKYGYARNLEMIGRRKSGELITALVSAEHFAVGSEQFFVTIVRDITEQRQAEEELRWQEAQLRQTQQLAKLGSWTLDLATGAETWSDILYDIFGVSQDVSPSYDLYAQLVHPDDLPYVKQRTREALRSGVDSFYLEHRIIRLDGSEGYLWIQTFFERDETGYALRAYGTAQDVTVTKRAELERDELKALLEAAVGQSPAGIIIVDAPHGEIRLINAAALMTGDHTQRQLMDVPSHQLALNWHTYYPDGTRYRPEDALLSRAIGQGETVTGRDIIIRHDDGREWWVMANSAPIYNNEQEIIAGIVVFSDITERKQAEKALQESEETARLFQQKLQKLHEITLKLSNLPTLDELYYAAVDLGKRELGFERFGLLLFDEAKDNICGTYGTDENGEMIDENHLRFPLSKNQSVQALLRDNQRANVWENADLWSQGESIGKGWCAIAILWDGQQGIGFISADNYISDTPPPPFVVDLMALYGNVLGYLITRKRAEQKINQYIQELQVFQQIDRAILQAESPQAIARSVLRPLQKLLDCKYVSVNKYNYDPEGFYTLANTLGLFFEPRLIPKKNDAPIQRLVKSGVLVLEDLEQIPNRYSIGDRWLENGIRAVTIVPLIDREDLFGSLVVGLDKAGRLSENQLRIIQQVATQLSIALRQSDLYKQLENYTDSLETLVAERTAQLESKASELEAFTYSVSHDLRAPLRAMNGFSKTLLQHYELQLPEKAQHYLHRIQYNAQRMGVLIDDLLALSRLGRKEISYKEIDTKMLIQNVFQELQADHQVGEIKLDIHDLPMCWGDVTLLRQVWFNLIINAIKYTRNEAEPTIEIGFDVQNMQTVYYIKDNGVGFDMAYIDKLFGVFQRLHNPNEYEGTGIGLAIVSRIIERHHGQVWAKGAINEGATFYFTLGDMAKEEDKE